MDPMVFLLHKVSSCYQSTATDMQRMNVYADHSRPKVPLIANILDSAMLFVNVVNPVRIIGRRNI
jgi:hypothetical protein